MMWRLIIKPPYLWLSLGVGFGGATALSFCIGKYLIGENLAKPAIQPFPGTELTRELYADRSFANGKVTDVGRANKGTKQDKEREPTVVIDVQPMEGPSSSVRAGEPANSPLKKKRRRKKKKLPEVEVAQPAETPEPQSPPEPEPEPPAKSDNPEPARPDPAKPDPGKSDNNNDGAESAQVDRYGSFAKVNDKSLAHASCSDYHPPFYDAFIRARSVSERFDAPEIFFPLQL